MPTDPTESFRTIELDGHAVHVRRRIISDGRADLSAWIPNACGFPWGRPSERETIDGVACGRLGTEIGSQLTECYRRAYRAIAAAHPEVARLAQETGDGRVIVAIEVPIANHLTDSVAEISEAFERAKRESPEALARLATANLDRLTRAIRDLQSVCAVQTDTPHLPDGAVELLIAATAMLERVEILARDANGA